MPADPFITTVERHFLERKGRNPHATEEFSWLLSGITLATKIIAAYVQRAGLLEIMSATGRINVQGEEVQKLDEFANETLVRCLGYRGNIGILVSEEDEEPHVIQEARSGKYIVLFDPLDGSSNINANVSIGTIFSILQRDPNRDSKDVMAHILQPGRNQVAAGYVVYGSSTVLAYTAGDGVHMFTLDPSIGAYLLAQENIRMPSAGHTYSVNEAYRSNFPDSIQRYLEWAKDEGNYTSRYIGSLVADFHRTLIRGGVFLYPSTKKSPEGKLRLLYEANPLAFVAEQADGIATDGQQRILDKQPQAMHERTSLIIGSKDEVQRVPLFLAMLRWFEHHQVYHPDRVLIATGAELGRPFEDISLRTSDGIELNGWFFPANKNSPRGQWTALVCHGNAGNISHRLELCAALLETGLNVFIFDYRGYGRSQGRPSEKGTYLDAEAAYDWLLSRGFSGRNIIGFGESLGGGIATELALSKPLGGLILESSFSCTSDLGMELFPWLPVRWLCTIQYETCAKLPRLKIPVLVIHSRGDELIGFHHAEKNYRLANEPKTLLELIGGHSEPLTDRPKFLEGIEEFLQLVNDKPKSGTPTDSAVA